MPNGMRGVHKYAPKDDVLQIEDTAEARNIDGDDGSSMTTASELNDDECGTAASGMGDATHLTEHALHPRALQSTMHEVSQDARQQHELRNMVCTLRHDSPHVGC